MRSTMAEARWPCPVCLGVKMEKTTLGRCRDRSGSLTLDHCSRCGGIWFELGEVQRLAAEQSESLWSQIPVRTERQGAQCHSCRALLDRDAPACGACGAKTQLCCPACDTRMLPVRYTTLTLDVCKRCQGVWFDHHELEAIWRLEWDRVVAKRRKSEDGQGVLFESLFWAPDLVAHATGHGVAAAAGVAPAAVDAVGVAAGSVFEAILEIVLSVFV